MSKIVEQCCIESWKEFCEEILKTDTKARTPQELIEKDNALQYFRVGFHSGFVKCLDNEIIEAIITRRTAMKKTQRNNMAGICPYCRNDGESIDQEFTGEYTAEFECECLTCGKKYKEIFSLSYQETIYDPESEARENFKKENDMRENMGLYRGRRIDNGEWVVGSLIHYHNGKMAILEEPFSDYGYEATEIIKRVEVDPETVYEKTEGVRT